MWTGVASVGQVTIPLNADTGVIGLAIAAIGIIAWWVRGMPDRKRAEDEGDGSLRKDLMDHIAKLEELRLEDRRQCQKEQDELRERIKALEDTLVGVTRDFLAYQAAIARLHPELGAIPLGHAEDTQGIENPLRSLYGIALDRPPAPSEPHKS